jgi:heterodisulfide reductase subunit C
MATYTEMKEMLDEIRADFRYDHELNGCLNCGICTATCPSAQFRGVRLKIHQEDW